MGHLGALAWLPTGEVGPFAAGVQQGLAVRHKRPAVQYTNMRMTDILSHDHDRAMQPVSRADHRGHCCGRRGPCLCEKDLP
jgi:hypothetical protein